MKTKEQVRADVRHLRQASKASCDSYIGRMTRQYLERQADEKEQELKLRKD